MNVGRTLFAQVMEFVPWKTFGRIIDRHDGDAGVRTFGCADWFRIIALAQLTRRESLRDMEACLAANQAKLLHMGMKAPPARSSLDQHLQTRNTRLAGLNFLSFTIADAFLSMYTFETTCHIQLDAQAGGELTHVNPLIVKGVAEALRVQTCGMGGVLVWPSLIRKLDGSHQS